VHRSDDEAQIAGEVLHVQYRVIVAPGSGVFRSAHVGAGGVRSGEHIAVASTVGMVTNRNQSVNVTSPFDGALVGMLARDGERVREGSPIAWLECSDVPSP
jgi:biotin carboxyl carrier protein